MLNIKVQFSNLFINIKDINKTNYHTIKSQITYSLKKNYT